MLLDAASRPAPCPHLTAWLTARVHARVFGEAAENGTRAACAPLIESCRAVSQRAAQTLKWVADAKLGLLTLALDHLTLGRAALYGAILENSAIPNPKSEIENAVAGLRRAGRRRPSTHGRRLRRWARRRHLRRRPSIRLREAGRHALVAGLLLTAEGPRWIGRLRRRAAP